METIETLIPDNEGNHLVVALYFYDDNDKTVTFQIPEEFAELDIADINISKLDLGRSITPVVFFKLSRWLLKQFLLYPNAVFSFICSTDTLDTGHHGVSPEKYRWDLFENLYLRYSSELERYNIYSRDIVVGPSGYQTYARVFYREKHSPIIHLVIAHLNNKYS